MLVVAFHCPQAPNFMTKSQTYVRVQVLSVQQSLASGEFNLGLRIASKYTMEG